MITAIKKLIDNVLSRPWIVKCTTKKLKVVKVFTKLRQNLRVWRDDE